MLNLGARLNLWKFIFSSSLTLLVVFWIWVVLAAINGESPLRFLRSLAAIGRSAEDPPVVPLSMYTEQEYGIEAIIPDDSTTASVNGNGNRIMINFAGAMDTETEGILTSWSVHTNGESRLDFRNYSWPSPDTFVIALDRSLEPGEYVCLTFRFTREGRKMPAIMLTYK